MYSPFFNDLNADPLFQSNMNLMNSFESMLSMPPMMSLMPGQGAGGPGMSGPGAGSLMPLANPLMGQMSPAAANLRAPMANPNPFHNFAPLPFFNMQSLFGNPMMSPQQNSFSSSTFVSMTRGPDGKPQVYKSSTSMKSGPGGVLETQHSEIDSVTGTKKMEIGHHIGDKSHIVEKKQNINTGDKEENEELVNLDEDELDGFKREWENKTRQPHRRHHEHHLRIANTPKVRNSPLALPPAVSQSPVANSPGSGRRLPHGPSSGHVRKNRLMKSVSGHHERKV